MEVIIEHTETEAYVFLDDTLRDSSPGLIRVWRSQDGAQISTRNGIIINTRGLGGDVMSAEVPVSSDGAGPSHSGAQTLQVRAGANTVWPAALTCDLVDLGPRTIEIVELQYATRHLRQTCEAHANETQGVVINDYWVDSGRGIVWQSRQWARPATGLYPPAAAGGLNRPSVTQMPHHIALQQKNAQMRPKQCSLSLKMTGIYATTCHKFSQRGFGL